MFSKARDFLQKERNFILGKAATIEASVPFYILLFIIVSNVFVMLNLSGVKLAFSYVLNYLSVYTLFALGYSVVFIVVWLCRGQIKRYLKKIIAHSIIKK